MKVLGIDYGTKHIGLALSDDDQVLARPWRPIKTTPDLAGRLANIVRDEDIERVVVGLPEPLRGQETAFVEEVNRLIEALKKTLSVPVIAFNEAFTTQRARQKIAETGTRKTNEHTAAAAEILQNYLDRERNSTS